MPSSNPRTSASRPHPVKVFGVGFPRTGTTSLVRALEILGIRSVHNPVVLLSDPDHPLLEEFDGFADAPLPLLYRKLDRRFPGSKFILTDRDADEWLASVRWMIQAGRRWGRWDESPVVVAMHGALYGSIEFDAGRFRARFERHRAEVLEHFRDRPDDLLVVDFSRPVGWDPLCRFLARGVPDVPFPHENRRAARFSMRGPLGWLRRKLARIGGG